MNQATARQYADALRRATVAALCMVVAMALPAQTPAESADPELETVLVTGEQPGPELWKVTQDEHVLWILGTYGPLPKNMQWRSRHVESLVAQSQEVLYPGRTNIETDIGMLRGLTMLPAMLKAARNPEGAKLKEVLPEEVYARWQLLKAKYLGKGDGVEKWRPTIALEQLRAAAIRHNGLVRTNKVTGVVNDAAKKHRVNIRRLPDIERRVKVENPRGILRNARDLPFSDVDCFSRSLGRLESDIEDLKTRANAWATGDVETVRGTGRNADPAENCMELLMSAVDDGKLADQVGARQALEDLKKESALAREKSVLDWMSAAQGSLGRNASTFAVLPMREVGDYVDRLRTLGYEVESP